MKPHPRIRKTIKWGGASTTLLLVVVWLTSGWGFVSYSPDGSSGIGLSAGRVWVQTSRYYGVADGFDYGRSIDGGWHFELWPWRFCGPFPAPFLVYIPLWPLIVLLLIPTGLAWRLDQLATRGADFSQCQTCHYNLTGLPANSPCPECGASRAKP